MRLGAMALLLWTVSAIVLLYSHCNAHIATDISFVNDHVALESALRDGVRHIVLTDHITHQLGPHATSRNRHSRRAAAFQTQALTRSIVGNCAAAPSPERFQLNEPVPKGACVVQVSDSFLKHGSHNGELWLHLLYVLVSSKSSIQNTSTAVLHTDGALWITNSVFQSSAGEGRAIDVNSFAGGDPRLFVSDTVVADFVHAAAPGVRLTDNTAASIVSTAFHRNIVPPPEDSTQTRIYGSAAALYPGAQLWLQCVSVQNNLVQNDNAAAKAFSFANGDNAAAVYSAEPRVVWDWTNAKQVEATPAEQRPFPFPRDGPELEGIREEQRHLMQQSGAVHVVAPPSHKSGTCKQKQQAPVPANVLGVCVASVALFAIMLAAWLFVKARRKQREQQEMAVRDADVRDTEDRLSAELPVADVPGNDNASHGSSSGGQSLNVQPPASLFGAAESIHNSPMSPILQIPPLEYSHNHADHNTAARLRIGTIQRSSSRAETTTPSTGRRHSILDSSNLDPASHRILSHRSRTPRISSALTLDIASEHSLPHPKEAGQLLDSELLCKVLDNLCFSDELFRGEYQVLGAADRRTGAQGVIQFAVHVPHATAVAIKFFRNRSDFDCEEELYTQRSFKQMMPAMLCMESNDNGVAETEEGWRYPPFTVVERGEGLEDWLGRMGHIQQDFPSVLADLTEIVERIRDLHALGLVHRNLKPGNVLWRPEKHSWTLIDFGKAALVEENVCLDYSLAYCPPEVLNEVQDGRTHVHASCAMDIWALGVIAFELAVRCPAFPPPLWHSSTVMEPAIGLRPYPWEHKVGIFSNIPELFPLERVVRKCLARDPKKRPTADQFCSVLSAVHSTSRAASVSEN